MFEIVIVRWIAAAWILTGAALLLAIMGYRRRVLEFLVLLLLIVVQIALLGVWTIGATAEATWQGQALVFRLSTVVDPSFALWYCNVVFWFGLGVVVLLLLAAVIRRRITHQDRQDFRMPRALRASAFLVEVAALVVMAGPANLSNGQPLAGLEDALSPKGIRQMQVVVVRPERKYGFLPNTGRKALVFLHSPGGKWLWKPVGQFGSPDDALSLEKEKIIEARCVWLDGANRAQIFLNMPGKTFGGWVCLLDYDFAADKQLPAWPQADKKLPGVEPETRPVTKPKAPPATKPKAPPATKPKAPPATKPKAPPATKPKAAPIVKPKIPPIVIPKAPPAIKPKAPPATKPKAAPTTGPKPAPATKPKTQPGSKP